MAGSPKLHMSLGHRTVRVSVGSLGLSWSPSVSSTLTWSYIHCAAMSYSMFRSSRCVLRSLPKKSSSYDTMNWSLRKLATAAAASGDTSNLPLAGIKVLDMTRVLAGVSSRNQLTAVFTLLTTHQPYCTQILGDLGYATLSSM